MTSYQKGILWNISSINPDGRIVLRHSERYFLDAIGHSNTIYEQDGNSGKPQYVLKFKDKQILDELINIGYTPRNSDIRHLPQDVDKAFIQACIELHGYCDWQTAYRRNGDKYRKVRLRIYGNKMLISQLNIAMAEFIGVTLKTPQVVTNKTYFLSYTSQDEIEHICAYFESEPIRYSKLWDKMRDMINQYNNGGKYNGL